MAKLWNEGITWDDVRSAGQDIENTGAPDSQFLRPEGDPEEREWFAAGVASNPTYQGVDESHWHPVQEFLQLMEVGVYPPPALLRALARGFSSYLDSGGDLSLEEAFFGKPKRRSGNFAARAALDQRHWGMAAIVIADAMVEGIPRIKAAERYVEQQGLNVDPETLVKLARRFNARLED
jgi:hypothetical protein